MCSLQEHSARSAREHEAQQQEPIYAELARERGVEWEAPKPEQATGDPLPEGIIIRPGGKLTVRWY